MVGFIGIRLHLRPTSKLLFSVRLVLVLKYAILQSFIPPTSAAAVLLSPKGQLGNQLFQYSCHYALARDLGWPFYVERGHNLLLGSYPAPQQVASQQLRDNLTLIGINDVELLERSFLLNRANMENRLFTGSYCQSPEYWIHYAHEIRTFFRRPSSGIAEVKNFLSRIRNASPSVAVHVRRSDSGSKKNYWLPFSYYRHALHKMKQLLQKRHGIQKPTFFVFSDDVRFARQRLSRYRKDEFTFIFPGDFTGGSYLADFHLMMECEHIIVGQSTFSWWAAFLMENPGKIVIAPTFNPLFSAMTDLRRNITGKLRYPREWKVINPFTGGMPLGEND